MGEMRTTPAPDLRYDYENARIVDAKTGPRREVTLALRSWAAKGSHHVPGDAVSLRFGSVANYEAVTAFFDEIDQSLSTLDELHYLRYARDQRSRAGDLFVEIEFDRTGDYIVIHCGNVKIFPGGALECT